MNFFQPRLSQSHTLSTSQRKPGCFTSSRTLWGGGSPRETYGQRQSVIRMERPFNSGSNLRGISKEKEHRRSLSGYPESLRPRVAYRINFQAHHVQHSPPPYLPTAPRTTPIAPIRTFPQRLAQPISFLLLASMTILWSDLHKHTGYGWRLASRAICPVIAPKAPKAPRREQTAPLATTPQLGNPELNKLWSKRKAHL
ncbi:hypothetical protein TNCV_398541 [Trichonephila clavipes]|nr:hypothetical protein TNCV_398541 [Trichonephila clavipes]